MKELLEINECLEIMEQSYERIRGLSLLGFMMFLGLIVDQYGADHGLTSEMTCSYLEQLAEAQKMVHSDLGMMDPTIEIGA